MPEEVELSGDDGSEEYEVIPMGPIRKLEKRIEELEKNKGGDRGDFTRDILDIMKANQKMVNDMVKSTDQLHNSVEELTNKMDTVADSINEFMGLLEEASEASLEEDVSGNLSETLVSPIENVMNDMKDTNEKMLEGMQSTNEKMLEGLGAINESIENLEKRMKRLQASERVSQSKSKSQSRGGQSSSRRSNRSGNRRGSRSGQSGQSNQG